MVTRFRIFVSTLIAVSGFVSCCQAIELRVEAFAGRPFGVARAIIPLAPSNDRTEVETNGYSITDDESRILYPVFTTHRVLAIVRELVGVEPPDQPRNITAWFLFRGDGPFSATIRTPEAVQIVVRPELSDRRHRRYLDNWWRQFTTVAKLQRREGDYPPVVETYLTTMLSHRLGVDSAELSTGEKSATPFSNELLRLTLNLESMRIDTMRRKLEAVVDASPSRMPLPAELPWPDANQDRAASAEVQIEPIALRVPRECFYVRFGSFRNYLWLKHLLEENGGSLGRMASLRGHDTMLGQKAQQQLGLKESSLAKFLGDQVVSDIAMIGHDTYLQEGAAIGILFQAKNGRVLESQLASQRGEAMKELAADNSKIETVTIDGRDVSFAHTEDNRLRSFQVADGDFHLVTNCRSLAERFLKTRDGHDTLGNTAEFRSIRSEVALDREDSVFVYLSRYFLYGLLSPKYQIELRRRLDSVVEMELLALARLAARNEGVAAEDTDDLIRQGFLPGGFGLRADESRIVESPNGLADSRRGLRGFFTPIPDMEVSQISGSESQTLRQIETFRATRWRDMDPLAIAVKRFATDQPTLERIRFNAWMVPFDREKYGTISSVVGPPTKTLIQHPDDAIISGQLSIQGGRLLPSAEPHVLFFGLKDTEMSPDVRRTRFLRTLQVLRTAPAYLGAWPKPGLLDLIPFVREGNPDGDGIARLPFGLWRWQSPEGFAVVSFDRTVLRNSVQALVVDQAEAEAQVRVQVGDVSTARIRGWFNALNYQRAYETSVGNTRFFHALHQQLGVPKPAAKSTAEQILGVKMICPLGGDYRLTVGEANECWTSSGWDSTTNATKTEFQSPVADWFRGLDMRVILSDDRVVAHGLLDVRRDEQDPSINLPIFDWLRNNPFGAKDAPRSLEPSSPRIPSQK